MTWWQHWHLELAEKVPYYSNTWKSKGYTFQGFQIRKKCIMSISKGIGATDM